ncbi:MAG: flagellin, partial [Synergistaceae bacterium]|nr:flagellin [Synergistaceae bacterium]
GGEDLLKALGLNVIQESRESEFRVTVRDAHSGELLERGRRITGNVLREAVGTGIDVKFDPLAGTSVKWNETLKLYELWAAGLYTTFIHLADNATTLQIGANEGEEMRFGLADMSARALGLTAVLAIDQSAAARAVTIIDNAIDRVSMQRARVGSYLNRLEHTIENLLTASANLTAGESRIRDADMAREIMNATKLQILLQVGVSLSAQANALPQNVLNLLR